MGRKFCALCTKINNRVVMLGKLPFLLEAFLPVRYFARSERCLVLMAYKRERPLARRLKLLLSRFSRVRLCDPIDGSPSGSPVPGILQARTLEWVAISFSKCMTVKSESEVAQSCPTLSDPMDCSLPGSSIHGIFQARVLEWVPITFLWRLKSPRIFLKEKITDVIGHHNPTSL